MSSANVRDEVYVAGQRSEQDVWQNFPIWFYDWLQAYLEERGLTFDGQRCAKRLRLGVAPDNTAA